MVEKVEYVNKEPYKIVLIGNSSVGKTNIYKRLNEEPFNPEENSTMGIDVLHLEVNFDATKKAKVDLWDTAGQERFRAVSKAYYAKGDGFFLIYDTTERNSYYQLESWTKLLSECSHPFPGANKLLIMILGNKTDLKSERQVTKEEAEDFAKRHGYLFKEISAKTKENITEATETMAKEIHHYLSKSPKDNAEIHIQVQQPKQPAKKRCCPK